MLNDFAKLPEPLLAAMDKKSPQFGIEIYDAFEPDIWRYPENALYRISRQSFQWKGLTYADQVGDMSDATEYIGKEFNSLTFSWLSIKERGDNGAILAINKLLRGKRVALRMMFAHLADCDYAPLIWWGRIARISDATVEDVQVECSQELGNFSYETLDRKFVSKCHLEYGGEDCLGTKTLAQKSLVYQRNLRVLGQGGCSRTEKACNLNENIEFFQGQKSVAIKNEFVREEKITKKFLFWKWTKIKRTNVPYSSKMAEDATDYVPRVVGRSQVDLRPILWADIGTQINALMVACKGEVFNITNIFSRSDRLTISNSEIHKGEYGGVGSQQLDIRFPEAGYLSKLAYAGVTYGGSEPANEGEDTPKTTGIVSGELFDVVLPDLRKETRWTDNPVWVSKGLVTKQLVEFIPPAFWDDRINLATANRCFQIVEDTTTAEISTISNAAVSNFETEWNRFSSTSRVNSAVLDAFNRNVRSSVEIPADIDFFPAVSQVPTRTVRSYLTFAFTVNGVIREQASLNDLLFSLVFPAFRGYLYFSKEGKIGIENRKKVDNAFITSASEVGSKRVLVLNVRPFLLDNSGFLLIGAGQLNAEVRRLESVKFRASSDGLAVSKTDTPTLRMDCGTTFTPKLNAPSELRLLFSGQPIGGERVSLTFTEPNHTYEWDYFADSGDTAETFAAIFAARLNASIPFAEAFYAEVNPINLKEVIIRSTLGYLYLDRPLNKAHVEGEEILRVVEIYESANEKGNTDAIRDNIASDITFLVNKREVYHGVTSTYINASADFQETEVLTKSAWDVMKQERDRNILKLDLTMCDNFRQASYLTKSYAIDFIDGAIDASLNTGLKAVMHNVGDCVAVRHSIGQVFYYTPMTVEEKTFSVSNLKTALSLKLYLSAAFDNRVVEEQSFEESTLTSNENYPQVVPSRREVGGYASVRNQEPRYEPTKYAQFSEQPSYSPKGRDLC